MHTIKIVTFKQLHNTPTFRTCFLKLKNGFIVHKNYFAVIYTIKTVLVMSTGAYINQLRVWKWGGCDCTKKVASKSVKFQ